MDYRISDFFISDRFINNLAYTKSKMNEINENISTGKQLRVPHHDTKNIGMALKYRTMITETEQYIQNADYSFRWLTTVEEHIRQIVEHLNEAKEIAVRGANGTMDALERSVLGENIEEILKSVVSEINSKYDNRYVFSKTQTQTQSLTVSDSDGDGYLDTFQGIEDLGLSYEEMSKEVGRDIYENIGYSAKEVFVDTGVISSLVNLRDALLNNNETGIRTALDEINSASASLRGIQGAVGEKAQRIQDRKLVLENFKEELQGLSSELEDTDLAEAITQLNNWQVIYQASLQATAQISKLSLVNFI